MLESLFVGFVVFVAAAYAAWALTPAPTRTRLALRSAGALGGAEARGLKGKLAARLLALAQAKAGGCGDCPANTLTPAERSGPNPKRDLR
jgi:hypothetical protein